jgi:hypothetical protein
MRMPFETISGALLIESLLNNNLIDKSQYDELSNLFDKQRNPNNYTLLWLGEITAVLDLEQIKNVRNHIIKEAEIKQIKDCYVAI